MPKTLDRKALLQKEELKKQWVDLGEDQGVYVRQMTAREKNRFEMSLMEKVETEDGVDFQQRLDDLRAKLAVQTVCDASGALLCTDKDVEGLSNAMSASRMELIADAAAKLNKISDKDRQELVKNSEPGPDGASNSA